MKRIKEQVPAWNQWIEKTFGDRAYRYWRNTPYPCNHVEILWDDNYEQLEITDGSITESIPVHYTDKQIEDLIQEWIENL